MTNAFVGDSEDSLVIAKVSTILKGWAFSVLMLDELTSLVKRFCACLLSLRI